MKLLFLLKVVRICVVRVLRCSGAQVCSGVQAFRCWLTLRGKCVEKSVGGGGSWAYILSAYALAERFRGKTYNGGAGKVYVTLIGGF
jgi:hypothetical protein